MALRFLPAFLKNAQTQISYNKFQSFRHISEAVPLFQKAAYEGDGKTKVNIFNTETEHGLMITGFSQYGFRLNNDLVILGPMALFPRSVLSWNVNNFNDITEDSLSIFLALEPKIDILILGVGGGNTSRSLSETITKIMKNFRTNVEVLPTEQACATFNFLNAENRIVAAALIPPLTLNINENDVLQAKLRHKKLYELDDE